MLPVHILNALNGSLVINNLIVDSVINKTQKQIAIKTIQDKNKLDLSFNYAIQSNAMDAIDDNDYSFEYHTCAPNEVLTIES